MDKLAAIRQPVLQEMAQYKALFDNALISWARRSSMCAGVRAK